MAVPNLDGFLGKNISDICGNNFHDPGSNHCAHFVSHAMGFTFSYNCKEFAGGSRAPANIRVHELFAQCPRVGLWANADLTKSQLIFVTRKDVVDLPSHIMQNIPQKHVGVYNDGWVYNYSNTEHRVVKLSVPDFLARFQAAYSGDQGLFFGDFPGSTLALTVDLTAASLQDDYAFTLRKDGGKWFAKRTAAGEVEYLAGVEVSQPAKKYFGLYFPGNAYCGPVYDALHYVPLIDQWAFLLDVTGMCESANRFNLINTYDRAQFTFGFYQMAAHTPGDNLILLFRAALGDAEFRRLFPDLELRGGKVFRVAKDGTAIDLEKETFDPPTGEYQLKQFMAYLNPERLKIDDQEVLQTARAVWWANQRVSCADLQVKTANGILQGKMSARYAKWYAINGESDVVCAIIADIHHQGRGTKAQVKSALSAANKIDALLNIGVDKYPERVATLKARIKHWTDAGNLGHKVYNAATNDFH
ncbi:MAG TPA: hypothetical protein VHL34_12095 [Rhizomicrobium sp.]|jgi:hypothetical protein|nr:hypothetical protein [Rhizomicrobium sp.]